MPLSLLSGWREDRTRDTRARGYVAVLMAAPDNDIARSLAAIGDRDEDHARWELRYARRAAGILVAERDALDDRTSSDVVASLGIALQSDPNVAADRRAIAERQLNDRLRSYRSALGDKAGQGSTSERLGRVLLTFAGASTPDDAAISFAAGVMRAMVTELNGELRNTYGEANLPPDVVPSALKPKRA